MIGAFFYPAAVDGSRSSRPRWIPQYGYSKGRAEEKSGSKPNVLLLVLFSLPDADPIHWILHCKKLWVRWLLAAGFIRFTTGSMRRSKKLLTRITGVVLQPLLTLLGYLLGHSFSLPAYKVGVLADALFT